MTALKISLMEWDKEDMNRTLNLKEMMQETGIESQTTMQELCRSKNSPMYKKNPNNPKSEWMVKKWMLLEWIIETSGKQKGK